MTNCRCCHRTYTDAQMDLLPTPRAGRVMEFSDRDGFGLEMRQCSCDNTLCRYLCLTCGYVEVDCDCEGEMLVSEFAAGEVAVA